MSQAHVPLVVLTDREDNVEFINRTLRDTGLTVRCHWIDSIDRVSDALEEFSPQLLWFFSSSDNDMADIQQVSKLRRDSAPMVPLLIVSENAHESMIADAMLAGAQDLVSRHHVDRLRSVAQRELRAYQLERALNETLLSAAQYRQQLTAIKAGTEDAIACSQEGVLVESNSVWAQLFRYDDADEMVGHPIMDFFEVGSQTTLKGGLIACLKGQWDSKPLSVTAVAQDGSSVPLELWLTRTVFDEDAAVTLTVPAATTQTTAPEELVEATVHRDPITGFYHRQHFVEMLTERLETNQRGGVRVLAYLRPDKFGDIKDEIGPLGSEEVLVQLAQVLRGLTQSRDLYGRFGGVVFTILLERGTLRDVEAWADNALTTISDHLFEIGDKTVSLTCTLGLSEVTRSADRLESILIEAEQANNRGRKRGGNQTVLAEISDESTRIRRYDMVWVDKLKAALMNDQFRLIHLPVVSLGGDEARRLDTVMRLLDEEGQEVPAAEFMPAAERHNMLKTLDRWVIDASLSFAEEQKPDLLFVKLSKDSVIDRTLPEWLEGEIKTRGVEPGRICFQVSEEEVVRHLRQTQTLVEALNALGFSFAVEHFGVGSDPMKIFGNIPMQFVKIDGSLMQGISNNQTRQADVERIVVEAKQKNVASIAERVEDANTMAVLFQLGVGYMQGHYVQEAEVILEDPSVREPTIQWNADNLSLVEDSEESSADASVKPKAEPSLEQS